MPLLCETNTPEMEARVQAAAKVFDNFSIHDLLTVFEHGQWWVECIECGAQWSVADAEPDIDGFVFERVTEGDGYCEET